ncbi:MAG TPA: hypothetical protein PK054_03395 [Anaerohalosphaeraceae bacterium]|nr:hypothetical protein [Anaerohalosphaeraceae bacterium]HOL89410.1 hypothetical protein [Anaerohalosphaeraceae bacterium]HPP55606.1 hypothetical protein [Anaerohalosphaeraceae bacterium]
MELDFIPSWYHENRRRRNWYLRRYLAIVLLTGFWIVGNLFSGSIISKAYADLEGLRSTYEKGLQTILQVRRLQEEISILNRQSRLVSQLRPRTALTPVLAELSRCIGERAVLTELTISQVPFESAVDSSPKTGTGIQVRLSTNKKGDWLKDSDTVTRIRLAGFALDGSEAAALISRLEESDYFTRVIPVYSKNETRFGTAVAGFEIQCVLADFVVRERN